MANFNYKVVVSNGFRAHKMSLDFEVERPDCEGVANLMDQFAAGAIFPEEGQILVNAETLEDAVNRGRVWYYFQDWMIDLYVTTQD